MRKLLTGLGIGAALALSALPAAADGMPGARRGFAPQAPCALGRFQGFYVGAHVGSAYYDWSSRDKDAYAKTLTDDLAEGGGGSTNGFIGGGQIGYNIQSRCTLFGVQADISWAGLKQSKSYTDGDTGINTDTITYRSQIDWIGTLRTRTGIVVDNTLFYVTGGFAFADVSRNWQITDFQSAPVSDGGGASKTRWGYVAGIGTEWAITNNLSLVGEASYIRFTDWSSAQNTNWHVTNGRGDRTSFGFDHEDSLWVGRIGLNLKIGGAPATVAPLK